MTSFGQALKVARKAARRKLRDISDITNLSISYISDIENGRKNPPTVDVIRKLEKFLCLSNNELHRAAQAEHTDKLDLKEFIQKRPPALSLGLLRVTEGMTDEELEEAIQTIKKQKEDNARATF